MTSVQLLPLLIFLLAAGMLRAQQTTISGHVLGNDGMHFRQSRAAIECTFAGSVIFHIYRKHAGTDSQGNHLDCSAR